MIQFRSLPRLYRFSRGSSSFTQACRFLTSSAPDEKHSNDKLDASALGDATLRGVGQVIFLNNPTCGTIVLGGLALGDPFLSVLAATGAASATATAYASGLDRSALTDGLWGYNGCLVGCAVAVFVHPPSVGWSTAVSAGLATTLVGAGASPFVAAALKPALGSVPQFTLAFNLVTLTMLLKSRPLLPSSSSTPAEVVTSGIADVLLHAPWRGISQIFVVESTLAGAALVGGIAYYSRGLAAHTVLGSSIGAATGALLGADMTSLTMGLWGFNSALTSLGVGVFFVHLPQTVMLSAGGAAATAAVFGAMSTVSGAYGSPCLTLPFCLTMSGCYLLRDAVPGLRLAKAPHSPEQNS